MLHYVVVVRLCVYSVVKIVLLSIYSIVLFRFFLVGCQLIVFLRSIRSNERSLCLRGLPIYGRLNSVTSLLLWFAETCVWARPALLRSFFHRNMRRNSTQLSLKRWLSRPSRW